MGEAEPRRRRRQRHSAIALALAVVATAVATVLPSESERAAAAAPYTGMVLDGEAEQTFMPGHVELDAVTVTGSADGFTAHATGPGQSWRLDVAPPIGEVLDDPVYGTEIVPEVSIAGLELSGNGSSCTKMSGSLALDEFVVIGDAITSLLLRFEVRCEWGPRSVFGSVAFNASSPPLSQRVWPRKLDFGTVPRRVPFPTKVVTLRNSGTSDLVVFQAHTSGAFTIVADTCSNSTLAPDATCAIEVEFDLTYVGAYRSPLAIPTGLTRIGAVGAFRVVLEGTVVHDRYPFIEQSVTVPGNLRPVVGDFDGDQLDHDIFWYAPGLAQDSLWLANGDRTWTKVPMQVSGTYNPVVGYFDGDRALDILWYAAGPRQDWIWYGGPDGDFRARAITIDGWFHPVAGPFDDDDVWDIVWYGPGTAPDARWFGGINGYFRSEPLRIDGVYDDAMRGYFDLNDRADLVWWSLTSRKHPLWKSTPAGDFVQSTVSSQVGGVPFISWYNDDARTDIYWYSPVTDRQRVMLAASGVIDVTMSPDYFPIVGNVTGDNDDRSDIVWWHRGTGRHRYQVNDPSTEALFEERPYGHAHGSWETFRAIPGYFDSIADNNAIDVLWYGPGAQPDRMFWGRDFDGPMPGFGTATATADDRAERLRVFTVVAR